MDSEGVVRNTSFENNISSVSHVILSVCEMYMFALFPGLPHSHLYVHVVLEHNNGEGQGSHEGSGQGPSEVLRFSDC